ncbi:hypothetical protein Lesp02_70150 [Lentzea sp. NBRC 105346]|uniref:hypothetical protein n=1 Tax=Lentzea sp. NBRC 105346 TaxID=3032205 RepID=UPI0024A5288B|nr:hypothetical protein [Lentzea sp. NBRC 105346]GLZ34828.1 hypothetical protein Lesp02_70150 [Lentzea sp. NBRC 105346]
MRSRLTQRQAAVLAIHMARPRRANILLLLWRWRYELALLIVVPLALHWLGWFSGPLGVGGVAVLGVITGTQWPAARRFLSGRFWCVLVQHRLRSAFVQARICTSHGRLPGILWTSLKPGGVKMLLFCPAGLDVYDIAEEAEVLAAACFAEEVVVRRHAKYAGVVELFVAIAGRDFD